MSTSPCTSPIRTVVLGFGLSGRIFHAPFLAADPNFEVTAIVTRDPERRDAARHEYPDAQLLDSFDDVVASAENVDLVVIGTPSFTHETFAAQALDAGLHVVVDKPFAVTSASGEALVERARERDRVLTVFQNRRWDGDFLTAEKVLASGELGEVRRFDSRFERWKPEADLEQTSWKTSSSHEEGGGVLFDLGSHLIDQALQLFGPVSEVYSEVDQRRDVVNAEDDVFLALLHDNGVRSHLWMSAVAPNPAPRFRLAGERGGYVSWGLDNQEQSLKEGLRPGDPGFGETPMDNWGSINTGEAKTPYPTENGDYGAFYRQLALAVRGEGPAPVDPTDAIEALKVIERAVGE